MNASVGLVIVDGEMNVSVSWTSEYPQVLLTDQLRLNDMDEKCNNFGRLASTGKSTAFVLLRPVGLFMGAVVAIARNTRSEYSRHDI